MTNRLVLVTGASGFIGRHLVAALLAEKDIDIRVLVRPPERRFSEWPPSRVQQVVGDLTQPQTLLGMCTDVDTVYHAAGYAHADDSEQASGEERHRRITVEGTRALIECATTARIKRFIFVSSVKAIGEGGERILDECSQTLPTSSYGKAKREAEGLVLAAGKQHGFHAVVLRLPLVYGRDNKGNIPRMLAAIDRGRFPPLPEVGNKRSMVHVDDVVRALLLVAADARAGGQCYIVTDGHEYSTRQLYELICRALGRRIPRWAVPGYALRAMARLGDLSMRVTRRPFPFNSSALDKLFGSARYSSAKIRREQGFTAARTFPDGLAEMIDYYRSKG